MPSYSRKISVPGKTAQELYDKISIDIDRFIDKVPGGKVEIDRRPDAKQVSAKSPLATATLICRDGELQLDASLSIFAAPFRSKIDDGINKWLFRTFNIQA